MTPATTAARTEPQASGVDRLVRQLRAARRRDRWLRVGLGAAVPLALLAVWQLAAALGLVDVRFFPPPLEIVSQSFRFVEDAALREQLLGDLGTSSVRLFGGFLLGTAAGLVVGLAMGLYRPVRYGLNLIINGTYPLPKLTLFPLMIILFGIDDTSKIALIALGTFYMVAINAAAGVVYSNPIFGDVARSLRVPTRIRFSRIIVPAALPSILVGLRLGFGQALILVVSTEFLAAEAGIGYFIWNSWQVLDVPAMFVGLAIVGVVGGLSAVAFDSLGRLLTPWVER